jgi:hypothetical protein
MKTRTMGLCLLTLAIAAAPALAQAGAAAVETRLPAYLVNFLPFDPASKVTVEKATDRLPGFQGYRIKRSGKYPKLAADRLVYVSDDGKWFFDGDTLTNPSPRPVQSAADLGFIESRTAGVYRTKAKASLAPERDAAGLKGVWVAVESGWGPVRIPGYVTPDGSRFFNGNASTSRRTGTRARPTGRSRSSSTPTWSAATAATAADRWTRCSRPTTACFPTSGTTSSIRSGSRTRGP